VKESLLGVDSWIAAAEEASLQTASEGGKRPCRRDVLRQTVPNMGCSDWKGPVAADSRVRRTNSDDDVVERRLALAGWLSLSARYGGAT